MRFPIVNGVPILINEQASVYSIDDCTAHRNLELQSPNQRQLKKTIRRLIPLIGENFKAKENYRRFAQTLTTAERPRVLVIGGRVLGKGMEQLAANKAMELLETDVAFGPRTMLICDAHDIPFQDRSFDGAVIQAVLSQVVDPYRCCKEIHRVLKDGGVVYAETPFIQQVHGRYDFTRFTHLGLRRLFRSFEEIDSGVVCGPGMALAWSYENFLLSFAGSRRLRSLIRVFAALTSFYLKYFDYYLVNKTAALDAASGYYFMGRKAGYALSDQDLIKLYKGAMQDARV